MVGQGRLICTGRWMISNELTAFIELAAVITCVAALCTAYHDGIELTQRIKTKPRSKRGKTDTATFDEALQELEGSLRKGEDALRTQYERDFGRFGESFASGDRKHGGTYQLCSSLLMPSRGSA